MMNAKGCSSPWAATVLTLFPDMFPGPLGQSVAGKALQAGIWSLKSLDIRAFAGDKHRSVDAPPFGGGPGMVLRPDVMDAALASLDKLPGRRIYLSPRGKCFDQSVAKALVEDPGVILICGRFEGLDQRLIDARKLEEISLGDYVLSGGEIAAQVLVEGCIRLIPGVLGQSQSLLEESFSNNLLEYPHYTRPQTWEDIQGNKHEVPDVLTSGHHEKIDKWRKEKSVEKTKELRPDLYKKEI